MDETFEKADAGASMTYPIQAGQVKLNSYVCMGAGDQPCKVVEYSVSKTGKHGHAKAHIVGIDIFTGKKLEELAPTTHNMPAPVVSRKEYSLIDVDKDGMLSLMDDQAHTKDDLNLPPDEELARAIRTAFEEAKDIQVTVLSAMGKEAIVSFKEVNPK